MATPVSRRTTRYWLLRAGQPAGRRGADTLGRGRRVPPAHPHPLAVAGTKPLLAAETGGTAIDLSSPPTRVHRLPGRHRQPGLDESQPPAVRRRRRTAWRTLLSRLGGAGGDAQPDPRRRPRPADGAASIRRPRGRAATHPVRRRVGLPRDAVAGWHTGAARRPSSDRDTAHRCSPRTISASCTSSSRSPTHVRENDFVVAALFSWRAGSP